MKVRAPTFPASDRRPVSYHTFRRGCAHTADTCFQLIVASLDNPTLLQWKRPPLQLTRRDEILCYSLPILTTRTPLPPISSSLGSITPCGQTIAGCAPG